MAALYIIRPAKTKPGRSGIRHVYLVGRRWRSGTHYNGKQIHLGTFDTPEEAFLVQHFTKVSIKLGLFPMQAKPLVNDKRRILAREA